MSSHLQDLVSADAAMPLNFTDSPLTCRAADQPRIVFGRISIPPPSWKPPAPSPCEARAGRGLGRGAPSIRIGAANWNPLSLTLSPLLRREERESTSGMVVVSMRPLPSGASRYLT